MSAVPATDRPPGASPAAPRQAASWPEEERCALAALATLPSMTPTRLRAVCAGRAPSAAWSALAGGRVGPGALGLGRTATSKEGPSGDRPARVERLLASWQAAADGIDPEALVAGWAARGLTVLVAGVDAYLGALAERPTAPLVLFARLGAPRKGQWAPGAATARRPSVALTGTRSSTAYGERVAAGLAAGLAACGVEVVTSLEPGIDAAVRAGAGREDGGALSVVAVGGADADQPAGTVAGVLDGGGRVVSEARFGTRPERWRYPRRNRLVALSGDVLVVVEAHATGGVLHAAEAALEAGVAVAAVPGSVHSPSSRGANALIADGAHVVRGLDDLLAVLAVSGAPPFRPSSARGRTTGRAPNPEETLTPDDAAVLASLREGATTHLEQVLASGNRGLPTIAAALDRLVAAGLAERVPGGYVRTGGDEPASARSSSRPVSTSAS